MVRNRRLSLERLEDRSLLTAGGLTQNEARPLDVNLDGKIAISDVLTEIHQLRSLRDGGAIDPALPGRFDVNADHKLTLTDALLIVQHLRVTEEIPAREFLPPRSMDGGGNNVDEPTWGAAGVSLLRVAPMAYGDQMNAPSGGDRPSAREISNHVMAQDGLIMNDRGLSDMVWQWGQFIDHDIDLTPEADPKSEMPVAVPMGDPMFDPFAEGSKAIGFFRSLYDTATGDSPDNPRRQMNVITAFIDGSNIYGSDPERAAALRTFQGGKLKTSEGDLLPSNLDGLANAGGPSPNLFLAGDIRANEQVGLTSMHTLWVREHNSWADRIAHRQPKWSDEQIYQEARKLVVAELQIITYNEFLPALLGPGALSAYRGYDATVNPGISAAFSTAAYRFGHSMLSPDLQRLNDDGTPIEAGPLPLRSAFFAPHEVSAHGIDAVMKGLVTQAAQEIDAKVVDDVRNFLFGPPGAGGFDLASLNIQRGRDHGLPDYNTVREAFGLPRVTDFSQITSDPEMQEHLREMYASVDTIDAWVGGLAEDHLPGASVGELVNAVLVDQFTRLRDGDRYWHQRTLDEQQLSQVANTTLAQVIRRNTVLVNLQENVFFVS